MVGCGACKVLLVLAIGENLCDREYLVDGDFDAIFKGTMLAEVL